MSWQSRYSDSKVYAAPLAQSRKQNFLRKRIFLTIFVDTPRFSRVTCVTGSTGVNGVSRELDQRNDTPGGEPGLAGRTYPLPAPDGNEWRGNAREVIAFVSASKSPPCYTDVATRRHGHADAASARPTRDRRTSDSRIRQPAFCRKAGNRDGCILSKPGGRALRAHLHPRRL